MKRILQKVILCAGALLASFGLARVPEQGEVETVAAGITAKLQGVLPDRTVESVEWVALEDSLGVWAVNLAPTGHLILGSSTKFRALLSWSEDDFVTPEAESPQEAILLELAQRMAEAEAGDGEEDPSWTQSGVSLLGLTNIDAGAIIYQPVDPTYWHQHGAMKWYVPGTAPCGCGATALSQVMYATRWPVYSEGFYETSLPYANAGDLTSSERYAFSPYSKIDYSIMDTGVPTDEKTPGNQQIANLVLLAEILSQMTFQPGTSGTIGNFLATNSWTMEPILLEQSGGAFSEAAINKMKAAAANGVPIFCTPPAHIVMGSGYAVVDGVHYVRLNYGWGGTSSGWYPMTDRGEYYIAYPKRTAQCDPLPAVSSAIPTLSWHIPLPYDVSRTTKPEGTDIREVNGFTVQAIAIPDEVTEPTTWTDDFSTRAKDCSGNTGALQLNSNELQVKTPNWDEPPMALYAWDPIFIPTEETVWTFSYMYHNARGPVQFQILPLGEGWKTLKTINPGNGAASDGWLEESLDLSEYAGKPCKLRLYVYPTYYRTRSYPNEVTFAMKAMGVSETQVITDVVKTIEIDSATVRNYTFTAADGLAVGTQYAFTVTPKFTDGAVGIPSLPCITRIADEAESFATLTFTSPSFEAAANSNMQMNQNIFRYCTYLGNSVIRVTSNSSANVTDLELYSSHPDAFPPEAFTVKKHGNGVFDIVIDGLRLPTWPRVNDCLNLTVCALTDAGTRTSHDLSLTFTDSAAVAFVETVPPCPAVLADFGDATTDADWTAANPTGGPSFEMTDALSGVKLMVTTTGTLQSVTVATSGFTDNGSFKTPVGEFASTPLVEMAMNLWLGCVPTVNVYGTTATQSSDGSDLMLTLSGLKVGECYTIYAIAGGTSLAPAFKILDCGSECEPVVHAVANKGTGYTKLATYDAGDILLVRAYNIYPNATGEIVLQTSSINTLVLAETDHAGMTHYVTLDESAEIWEEVFAGINLHAKDKVELTVTATGGTTLTLDSDVALETLTVTGNPLTIVGDGSVTMFTSTINADLDVSAISSFFGTMEVADNTIITVCAPSSYREILALGTNSKIVYKTVNPVTTAETFVPTGTPFEIKGGTYSNVFFESNSTATEITLSGGNLTFPTEMAFGTATVNITGGTYTTPTYIVSKGGERRPTTVNQSGGDIIITGTQERNTFLVGQAGWYFTDPTTYNLTGGTITAEHAGLHLSQHAKTTLNINGGTLKVKGIRGTSDDHYQRVTLNMTGGKLSIGSYNWPVYTTVYEQHAAYFEATLSGGELNAFDNSIVGQSITIAGNLTMSADAGKRLTIASTLTANNGTRTITKTGPGELDVSGATLSGTFNFVVNEGRLIVNAGSENASNITMNGGSIGIKLSEEQMISGYTANKAVTFYDPDGVEITDPEMLDGDMAYVPLNTWTVGNDNNWSTASNWSKGVIPGAANSAIISISGDTTINLTEAAEVENLSVIGSGTLTIVGAAYLTYDTLTIRKDVSVLISVDADTVVSLNSVNGLGTLIKQGEGTVSFSEDTSVAIQVDAGAVTATNASTLSGVISGDGKVTGLANATFTLSAANTYTGGTDVASGATVIIKNSNALGSGTVSGEGKILIPEGETYAVPSNLTLGTVKIEVASGATWDVNGRADVTPSAGTLILNDQSTLKNGGSTIGNGSKQWTGLTLAEGATATVSGNTFGMINGGHNAHNIYLNGGTLDIAMNSDATYYVHSATFYKSADDTESEAGTIQLTSGNLNFRQKAASAAKANLVLNGGVATVQMNSGVSYAFGSLAGADSELKVNSALTIGELNVDTVYAGILSGSETLTKIGTGTLTLSGENTYTGTLTVAGGMVKILTSLTSTVIVNAGAGIGGSGTIDGALTLNEGAIIDATSPVTVTGAVSVPTALTITGVTPTEDEPMKVLSAVFTTEMLLTDTTVTIGDSSNYRLLQQTDGLYVKAMAVIEEPLAAEFAADETTLSLSSIFDPVFSVLETNQLEIAFTANGQSFIFDNGVDYAFSLITVNAADGVDASTCSLVSADGAGSISATNTTLNTSIDASALNGSLGAVTMNGELTLKVGSADAVSSLTATGGTIEVCADVDYTQGGTDLLSLSAFANNTFKVGDGKSVKLKTVSTSGGATVYGNIIVGENATLDVNGRLAVNDTTVTLCDGATLTSSTTVGNAYNWISWPFVNLQDAETTATISGTTFSSVYSGNNAHTWNLNGGTLKFAMNEGATFRASTLNFTAGTVEVVSGTLEFGQKDVTEANANLVVSGGTVAFNKKHYFASLAGSGTITGTLALVDGMTIDVTQGVATATGATISLPTDGTLTVKVNALPAVDESVAILNGTVSGTCAGVISVDGKTYAATISQGDGMVIATRTQTVISNPEIEVGDSCTSLSDFLGEKNVLDAENAGDLTLTFTADNQIFTFDNVEALVFTSITVAESAFTGCKVVFIGETVTTAALIANANVEVPLALINDANVALTVPTGKTLTVNVATEATLNRAISFDGIFAKKGDATLTLGANVAPAGGTIVAEGTLKFGAGLIPYGGNSSYPTTSAGDVTVCGGATLDVNGKPDAFLNMVTLQEGATFANSSGTQLSSGSRQLKGLTLEGNATVHANANFGILAGGHAAATLSLNGHTLTKTGTANFWLSNTAVTEGTLSVEAGAFKSLHQSGRATTFTNVTLAAGAEGSSMVLTGKVAATIINEEGDVKVDGKIENGTDLVGSVSVTKGAAILSGTNTYTGGSVINEGTTLKVATAGATGSGAISGSGLLEACADITYSGSDPLEANTFNGKTFKVGDGISVTLAARDNSGSATADVYGNIIVGEGATLNVNGRLAVADTTVTLCDGATLTSSATVGSGYSWISWPFVNLAENATATISGATFSSVYSGNNAHTWDLNNGTLKFAMNEGATFKASTLNFTAGTVEVVSGTLEFGQKNVTEANANLVVSGGTVAFNKKHYFASVGGTGTVTGTLTIPDGATLDASMGALTANSVTWNGEVVIQVPEEVADWATGVCVLKTSATNLPTSYTIQCGETTFSNVTLTTKTVDSVTGIYAVEPSLPEISVGGEVIEIAASNLAAIQEAAAKVGVEEITSIVGAVLSDAKTVDVVGLELFEDVAVELDADTGVATISYAFGISRVALEADGKITVTATVSNLDKSEGPSFAEGVIVKLYSGEKEIPSTVVSESEAMITIKTNASIAEEFATQPSWSKPLIIKAIK